MHFGENQLSPSSIGISPLPTSHPTALQRWKVRASIPCYRDFTLPMGSSLGFGSTSCNSIALFRLAFATAPSLNDLTSLQKVTRRLILQKARHQAVLRHIPLTACRHMVSGSISLPSRGSFHLSLT